MYVATFYHFAKIDKLVRVRDFVEDLCIQSDVQGTCILATEGINATLAHANDGVLETIIEQIKTCLALQELRPTLSRAHHDTLPFDKLLVQIRPEIVSYGTPFDFTLPILPTVNSVQWNDLLQANDVIVLDVRNQYEHDLGRFRNSIQPGTKNFREFKEFLQQQTEMDYDQPVAVYCTGGIRCEKAAQSMFKQGFKSVIQLDRGILGYLEESTGDSFWEGECFVFDQRVALNESLLEGSAELCLACGGPLSPNDKVHRDYEHGISCSACHDELTPATHARRSERLRQLHLARRRGGEKSSDTNVSSRDLCV
ncbi:MAG: rhodanese-like domain-containing protein [Gammaproteobacteria bacterium]|nr:rhodanese-like domain-containing protein [Gammaproteobacteria bacterium]